MANHLSGPQDTDPDGAALVAAFRRRLQDAETRRKVIAPSEGNVVSLPVTNSPVQIRVEEDTSLPARIEAIREMTRKAANITPLPVKLAPASQAAAETVMRAPAQIPDFVSWITTKSSVSLFGDEKAKQRLPVGDHLAPVYAVPEPAPALAMATMAEPPAPVPQQASTPPETTPTISPIPALVRYSPQDFTPKTSYISPLAAQPARLMGKASRFFLYAVAIGIGAFVAALGLFLLMNGALG
jgi:hypothetical protein